jgi:tRNA threonylcarbamoyladenosine biosynthesis protein TsaB
VKAVSSLEALAAGVEHEHVLALIDARRGEVFAGLYGPGKEEWPPFAAPPEEVVRRVREAEISPLAAGDGSIRFRGVLEAAGIRVEPAESRSHVVRALYVCRLAAEAPGSTPQAVVPDYLRAPDARPQ